LETPVTSDKRDPRDHHIWRSDGGMLYVKITIPPNVRERFPSESGKPKIRITESLGTDSFTQARILRDQRVAHWQRVFARLEAGAALRPEEIAAEQHRVRRSTLQALLVEPPAPLIPEEERMFEAMQAAVKARRPMIEPSTRAEVMDEARRIADEKFGPGIIANGSPEWNEICQHVAAAKAKALEDYLVGVLRGGEPVVEQPLASPMGDNGNGNLERFSVALGHFLDWHRNERKSRPGTIAGYESQGKAFVEFSRDAPLGGVDIDMARAFIEHLAKKGISNGTLKLYQGTCRAVFDHVITERGKFSGINPFGFKPRKHEAKHKAKFTVEELNKLFGSSVFTGREIEPATHSVATALPWAALIALYTGASREEICQLRKRDICKEAGVWVVDITPEAALSGALKRRARKRIIPLHPELERLGLLKYRDALNSERLFPGLPSPKNDDDDKIGGALGKSFGRWRDKLGIGREDAQLDFHSFRHCFGKSIEDAGISAEDRARLMGHAVKGISSAVYSGPELKRVAPQVARVTWAGLVIK
jgi:integrase